MAEHGNRIKQNICLILFNENIIIQYSKFILICLSLHYNRPYLYKTKKNFQMKSKHKNCSNVATLLRKNANIHFIYKGVQLLIYKKK